MSNPTKEIIRAKNHESYSSYTLIALLLPIVGLILGVVYLAKNAKLDKKFGEHLVAISILFTILQGLLLFVFLPIKHFGLYPGVYPFGVTAPTVTNESTPSSAPPAPNPTWDVDGVFDQLSTGMTKADVEKLTGKVSQNCTVSQYQEYKSESCSYGNPYVDGGSITAIFSQDKLSSKAKTVL